MTHSKVSLNRVSLGAISTLMERGSDSKRPIVELSRRFTFSAAHRLHSKALNDSDNVALYGKCNHANGHGHNYAVELYFRGPVVRETGMVVNITEVKKEVAKLEAILDHKNIDQDVLYFDKVVSSAENIAVFIWEQLKAGPLTHLLSKVEVWETEEGGSFVVPVQCVC